jgi:hypothetical protein
MAGQARRHEANGTDTTIEKQLSDEQGKERSRWRPRLNARMPVPGRLILAGVGVIGVAVMVLTCSVFHRQPSQIETMNLTGASHAMMEAQLKNGELSLREIYEMIPGQPVRTRLGQTVGVNLIIARAYGNSAI